MPIAVCAATLTLLVRYFPNTCRIACCLAASLCLPGVARAEHWFGLDQLSAQSGMEIEVDTDSLREVRGRRSILVRVTYPQPRVRADGLLYRSAVATVEFECEGRLAGYRDAALYAGVRGQGGLVARESSQLAQIPEPTRGVLPASSLELLTRAACSRPTPAVP
jgi:hypothetical protein